MLLVKERKGEEEEEEGIKECKFRVASLMLRVREQEKESNP
jgi:hypothetical protein